MSRRTINAIITTICAIVIANLILDLIIIKEKNNE